MRLKGLILWRVAEKVDARNTAEKKTKRGNCGRMLMVSMQGANPCPSQFERKKMVKIQVDIDRLSDICQPKEVVIPDYWEGENYSFMLSIGKIRLNINAYSKKIISGTNLLNLNGRLELDVFGVDIDCRETNNWWGSGSPIGEEDVGICGRPFRDWYGSWYDFFAYVASYYKYAFVQMPKQL